MGGRLKEAFGLPTICTANSVIQERIPGYFTFYGLVANLEDSLGLGMGGGTDLQLWACTPAYVFDPNNWLLAAV